MFHSPAGASVDQPQPEGKRICKAVKRVSLLGHGAGQRLVEGLEGPMENIQHKILSHFAMMSYRKCTNDSNTNLTIIRGIGVVP